VLRERLAGLDRAIHLRGQRFWSASMRTTRAQRSRGHLSIQVKDEKFDLILHRLAVRMYYWYPRQSGVILAYILGLPHDTIIIAD